MIEQLFPVNQSKKEISQEILDAQREFIDVISDGHINYVIEMEDKYNITPEFISSPEVQGGAQKGFINCLSMWLANTPICILLKYIYNIYIW